MSNLAIKQTETKYIFLRGKLKCMLKCTFNYSFAFDMFALKRKKNEELMYFFRHTNFVVQSL